MERHEEQSRRVVERRDPRARLILEPAIQADCLLVQRHQGGIERVLDDAGIAARRSRGERLALVERDPGAGLGKEDGSRRPDDPAADDRDVDRSDQIAPVAMAAAMAPEPTGDAEPAIAPRLATRRSTSASVL